MISVAFLLFGMFVLFFGIQAEDRPAAWIFAAAGILSILIGMYLA